MHHRNGYTPPTIAATAIHPRTTCRHFCSEPFVSQNTHEGYCEYSQGVLGVLTRGTVSTHKGYDLPPLLLGAVRLADRRGEFQLAELQRSRQF
jgi:hypothetical protein